MKKTLLLFVLFGLIFNSYSQHKLLESGPMLGYSEMREVAIWAQTKESAKVKVIYWDTANVSKKFYSDEVITKKDEAFTAHLIADNVEPGKYYEYNLVINGETVSFPYKTVFQTQKLWQWRTNAPDFSFVTGSCAYVNEDPYDRPGRPYGGPLEIFNSIADKKADFMVWMGDNVYLREVDFYSRTGILKRYTHDRATKEMQKMFATMHHYAIWDDHDFGHNDADRGFRNKYQTLDAFKLFWANPTYGSNGNPGVNFTFKWGDAEFFMLDNRFNRTPDNRHTGEKTILGEAQLQWLFDVLATSDAKFKFIVMGGQFLNTVSDYETYSMVPEERNRILNYLEKESIKGVIFLTGDRHFTELSKLPRANNYPLHDFTVSPFTSGFADKVTEANTLRVPGTMYNGRNFAKFDFSGAKETRAVTVTIYNIQGEKVWDYKILAKEIN